MPRTVFENEVVRLADLAVTTDLLQGHEFKNCLVLGPAVVAILGSTIENSTFVGPSVDALYWPISAERSFVLGAIGLEDCTFTDCRFERVGFAGGEELRAALEGAFRAED